MTPLPLEKLYIDVINNLKMGCHVIFNGSGVWNLLMYNTYGFSSRKDEICFINNYQCTIGT